MVVYHGARRFDLFLHGHDFTGKTVVPFMTNGGWPGHVIKRYENACRGADFACDMQVRFDSSGGDRLETSEKRKMTESGE